MIRLRVMFWYKKVEPPYGDEIRVSPGAQKLIETSQNSLEVEEFLAGLRFEQRGKLEKLIVDFQSLIL